MALSSRAHAFSVEVLVGNSPKRKLLEVDEERPEKGAEGSLRKSHGPEKKSKADMPAAAPEQTRDAPSEVQVDLQGSELWKRFHDIGTEMIITKAGRRMFPSVRVKERAGLGNTITSPSTWCRSTRKDTGTLLPQLPVDGGWGTRTTRASCPAVHSPSILHVLERPGSRQIIKGFDRVKLTNNEMDDKGHIILQSMHKYKPRVHVIVQDSRFDLSQIQSLPAAGVQTFSFKETEFTTVTAYQNQQITKLKIDRNPFAKGFRDPGRNRGVLDGLLESYPWRPSLTLDFKSFGGETQGGSPGSSPATHTAGTPSPLASLLSPACSPPAFHLSASNLGMFCPESCTTHHLSLRVCYKICPSGSFKVSCR
uniref:Uncharacterized protein n=1 Tax=Sphaerodactylus townsendi TaxID=933632 RepID=A0ACB8FWL6_9SAUR